MTPALELRGVTKEFPVGLRRRRLRVLDGLSLRVAAGEIYGLLGANGSGKSTTIRVALGLTRPDAGCGAIFGFPCGALAARERLGYLPESPRYPGYLTGRELVRFYAGLSGMAGRAADERTAEVLEWAGLAVASDRRLAAYSKGMLQRLGLAQAIVHRPRLVILDEPTAGVDLAGAKRMLELIRQLGRDGVTVLLTSHHVNEVEDVCDRVGLLERGRLAWEGRPRDEEEWGAGLSVTGAELSPEDRAELKAWLAKRGCGLAEQRPARTPLATRIWRSAGQAGP